MDKTKTTPELENKEVLKEKSVQEIIKAEVARLLAEKEKLLAEEAGKPRVFEYPAGLSPEKYLEARIANNDRVTKFYYSAHFSKERGAYTKWSMSLTPYLFSEGYHTYILDEHMATLVDWVEAKHYPHGDAIEQDPSLLAAMEAWHQALANK